jgi:GntR family transcriptional regulator
MNPSLPLPKYHQIYLVLCEQLQEGKFDAGLPGELALMQQFAVARVTVRRALSQMAEEGLIKREPGRGTRPLRSDGSDKLSKSAHASHSDGQQAEQYNIHSAALRCNRWVFGDCSFEDAIPELSWPDCYVSQV